MAVAEVIPEIVCQGCDRIERRIFPGGLDGGTIFPDSSGSIATALSARLSRRCHSLSVMRDRNE
jgi:hypothetical protein